MASRSASVFFGGSASFSAPKPKPKPVAVHICNRDLEDSIGSEHTVDRHGTVAIFQQFIDQAPLAKKIGDGMHFVALAVLHHHHFQNGTRTLSSAGA
jgi:hypothetical protein